MVIKKTRPTSKSTAKTAKSSVKKNVTDKKTVKKAEVKEPVKAVKTSGTKLPSPKTTAKPAVKPAAKSVPETKKLRKPVEVKKTKTGEITAKKPDKTSHATAKEKKAQPKESPKKIRLNKSEVPEKKPLKKSPVKTAKPKTADKAKVKTAKKIKTPSKTVSTAKAEKKSTVKTGLQKKPAVSSAIRRTKETVEQKTVLKSKKKTETPLPTVPKTVKKKVASEHLPEISKKTTVTYAAPSKEETKPQKASNLKVFLPEESLLPEEAQQAPLPQLPEEYGENELIVMEVDPSIVFVSWEIKPEAISGEAGKLALRVYDVTGIDFDGANAHRSFDISLRNRADSKFFDVKMQGREIIMEIGLVHPEGAFKALKRSNRVSMPALQTFEEIDITGPLSDDERLVGY